MLKSVGSNWGFNLATVVVAFILPPILIHSLGVGLYGEWLNIVALTGPLTLLLLGMPMGTVHEFAKHIANRDQARLNRSIASALCIYAWMACLSCVAGAALFFFFDRVYVPRIRSDLGDAAASQARAAFLMTVLQLAFGSLTQVPMAIITAHRDFVIRNAILLGGLLLRVGLVVGWLRSHASLMTLAAIQIVQLLAEGSITAAIAARRYPGTRLGFADRDRGEIRKIIRFSAYALLLAVGYKLVFQTSAPILRAFQDTNSVAAFDQSKNLIIYLTDFILAIEFVVMPTATKYAAEKRGKDLVEVFLRWSKIAFSIGLVAGLYLAVIGESFIKVWIHKPDFDTSGTGAVLAILVLSHLAYLPARGVGLPVIVGLGKPERPAIAFLICGVATVALGLALVRPLGMIGVALAIGVADCGFAIVTLKLACNELGVPWHQYVGYVAGKATLGALPVLALLVCIKATTTLDTWFPVLSAGVASTAVFAAIWLLYVYRNDPFVDAWGRLRRIAGLERDPSPSPDDRPPPAEHARDATDSK